MTARGCNILVVLMLLAVSACNFPQPTRPENYNRNSSSSSAKETSGNNPEDLQTQVRQLKADHQATTDDWDQKVRTLQDKIDMLEHSVMEDQKKNEKINQDIDRRLTEIEKRTYSAPLAAPVVTAPVVTAPSIEPAKPTVETPAGITPEKNVSNPTEQQYQTILDAFLEEKNYDRSIKEFKKFIQAHSKDPLAGNAQYWIGEGYYSKGDYPKAITEFQKVIDNYPNSTKKCDTLLKQGMAFSNMKDPSNAKLFLKETVDQCSGTTAAEKAKKLL
jgi:tol-pal system protein YbgF